MPQLGGTLLFIVVVLAGELTGHAQAAQQDKPPVVDQSDPVKEVKRDVSRIVAHDKLGRIISEMTELDEDLDGIPDRRKSTRFHYDDYSRLATKITDYEDKLPNPAVRHETVTFEYDGDGRLIQEALKEDRNGDGIDDLRVDTKFTYNGRLMATKTTLYDEKADGKIERREVFVFSYADDEKLAKEVIETDFGNDGTIDTRVANTFVYEGKTLTKKIVNTDKNMDGRVDSRENTNFTHTNGGQAAVETKEIDLNADGVVDQREKVVYNMAGQMERRPGRSWLIPFNVVVVLVILALLIVQKRRRRAFDSAGADAGH